MASLFGSYYRNQLPRNIIVIALLTKYERNKKKIREKTTKLIWFVFLIGHPVHSNIGNIGTEDMEIQGEKLCS